MWWNIALTYRSSPSPPLISAAAAPRINCGVFTAKNEFRTKEFHLRETASPGSP
jgi:hypothetical protein